MKKPTKRRTTTAKKPAKRAAPSPFPRPGHAASTSTSSSVVRSRAGESDAITMAEYGGLQAAFDYLNAKLFGGRLPDAFITYTRKAHSYGHFSEDRYSARDGQFKKPEISLNPDAFVDRTDEQIVGTLAHEMKHLEQCRFRQASLTRLPQQGVGRFNEGDRVDAVEHGRCRWQGDRAADDPLHHSRRGLCAGLRRTRRHWMEAESAKHDLRGRGEEEEEGRQDEVHLSGMRLEHVGQTGFQGHLRRVQPMA
jgi:hypothetical protein